MPCNLAVMMPHFSLGEPAAPKIPQEPVFPPNLSQNALERRTPQILSWKKL